MNRKKKNIKRPFERQKGTRKSCNSSKAQNGRRKARLPRIIAASLIRFLEESLISLTVYMYLLEIKKKKKKKKEHFKNAIIVKNTVR